MQANAKTSVTKRLSRIEGQVRGLARMVEDDRYCIDIVTQISAVRAALAGPRRRSSPITWRIASNTPSRPATRPSKGVKSRNLPMFFGARSDECFVRVRGL